MTQFPRGMALSSAQLADAGVSADLAVHYVKSGWLTRLARGVYLRAGEALELHPALRTLEHEIAGLHVGGKTAMDWYGIRHYVAAKPQLNLYGWDAFRVPTWFNARFPARYRRKRLFNETPKAMPGVTRFRDVAGAPLTSEPERAFLEMLSEVGVHQSLSEAKELTDGTYTLRHEELGRLLAACRSVKTVRLALTLGRELGLPWVERLDPKQLPTGSANRWVSRSRDGLLVLKR